MLARPGRAGAKTAKIGDFPPDHDGEYVSGDGVKIELAKPSDPRHLLADQPTCCTYMRLKLPRPCPSVHVSRDCAAWACPTGVRLP